MYMKDLGLLYKSLTRTNHSGSQGYMLDLLSKFELALQFDKDKLLVPSLLPAVPCEKQVRVSVDIFVHSTNCQGFVCAILSVIYFSM